MDKVIGFLSNPFGAFLAGAIVGAAAVYARFIVIAFKRGDRAFWKSLNS